MSAELIVEGEGEPRWDHIAVKPDTGRVLRRIREDESYPTFDMLMRKVLKRAYPDYASDL